MLYTALSSLLLAAATLASASPVALSKRNETVYPTAPSNPNITFTPPTPPKLEFLYRAYVLCPADVLDGEIGPLGQRKAIPIVGGNVTLADGTTGEIRNLGADEGLVDPQTGIFKADTRYHVVLNDANSTDLYFKTNGPKQADGYLHLHINIETASRERYYLNNVVAVGQLHNVGRVNGTSTLQIDAFNMVGEWNSTTFIN
ncbi:hypothetical protein JCM8097_009071 [Rhodosporidiobolus ruineniae]